MQLDIVFGGDQGQGIDKVASMAGDLFSDMGYYIFKYRDYGSLIKGGHSFDVLSVSDEPIASHSYALDGILALDDKTVEKHKDRLKDDGFIINAKEIGTESEYGISFNMLLLGAVAKTMGVSKDKLQKVIERTFEGKEEVVDKNIQAADEAYSHAEKVRDIEDREDKIEVMSGSQGIAEGAVRSGIDVYLAYPMTPATPVLHLLAGRQREDDIAVLQPENELSVVNAGLGAAHTGAKTMVGSSGGGYDLMQEAMSMQGISEIPLVVYLSQRAGAGSGIPTYTAQGDLEIAVHGSHGEAPRVVIAPGDAVESVEATNQAFYFAENFRALSILLGDKHVAESDFSMDEDMDIVDVGRNIDQSERGGEYRNYKVTEDGNSPRSVPGLNVTKSTSYEHDEYGITIEDEETINAMTDKRKRKGEKIRERAKEFTQHKVHGDEDSDTVVVGWGSTKGAIKDAISGMGIKFLQIIYLEPFPEEVTDILEDAERTVLVENNSTGLLGDLITENTGHVIDKKILKYDGRPFHRDKLREKIKKVI
ncbi:MAG: 2-oxoacid:acceptor oxidoreductase family protein [Candidatus Aenigmatarchaeota archaeon]